MNVCWRGSYPGNILQALGVNLFVKVCMFLYGVLGNCGHFEILTEPYMLFFGFRLLTLASWQGYNAISYSSI